MLTDKIFNVAQIADQVVLYILIILSVVSVGLIIERFLFLRKVSSNSERVRSRIRNALQTNALEDVESLSKEMDSVEGRALACGLRHYKECGVSGLEEIFNTFSLSEKPELERSLNMLATIGSNAPYIGLLGTVLGIMKAFNDLARSSDAGQQTVMAGISLALVATATGLFVAIPAVIAYNYYQKQVKKILQSLEAAKELCIGYAKKRAGNRGV